MREYKPSLISWNITKRCNLRCAHCYLDASESGEGETGELSTREGLELIDQIAEVSPNALLVFTGGEPLLRKDFLALAERAVEKNLVAVLGTNGTLIDEEMAEKLRGIGIRGVGISLDSLNSDKHDAFRGVEGAWERAMKGIDACRGQGLEFQIQTTVTRKNYDEISRLIEYASSIGAKAFNLFFLVCTGRGQKMTDISPAQYERMLSYLVEVQGKYKTMIRARCAPHFTRIASSNNRSSFPLAYTAGCLAGIYYCRITPEGAVTPCPYLPMDLGNVRKRSLADIWKNSKVLARLRNPMLGGRCGRCEFASTCGGCRARAFGIHGDYMAEDPWCLHRPGIHKPPLMEGEQLKVVWNEEAKKRMEKAPAFLREIIMRRVELYALEKGQREITPEILAEAKQKWRGGT